MRNKKVKEEKKEKKGMASAAEVIGKTKKGTPKVKRLFRLTIVASLFFNPI